MSLRYAALGMLSERPGSGYDLLKRFETAMSHVWPATQSQLYGELGKLEADALIEVSALGPRRRKEYAITGPGREALVAWLLDAPPPAPTRNETMLRVYFLGAVPPDQARAYLERIARNAAESGAALDALHESIPWDDHDESLYGGLVLEWGRRMYATQRDWARWAADRIAAERGTAGQDAARDR